MSWEHHSGKSVGVEDVLIPRKLNELREGQEKRVDCEHSTVRESQEDSLESKARDQKTVRVGDLGSGTPGRK